MHFVNVSSSLFFGAFAAGFLFQSNLDLIGSKVPGTSSLQWDVLTSPAKFEGILAAFVDKATNIGFGLVINQKSSKSSRFPELCVFRTSRRRKGGTFAISVEFADITETLIAVAQYGAFKFDSHLGISSPDKEKPLPKLSKSEVSAAQFKRLRMSSALTGHMSPSSFSLIASQVSKRFVVAALCY